MDFCDWTIFGGGSLKNGKLVFSASGYAVKTFVLNQAAAMPVRISCDSSAENAIGNNYWEYSVLTKVTFMDGTTNRQSWAPLNDGTLFYLDYAAFPRKTHGLCRRTIPLCYDKPIASVEVNLYFQNHTGSATFENCTVTDFANPMTPLFDYLPIENEDLIQKNIHADTLFIREYNHPICPAADVSDIDISRRQEDATHFITLKTDGSKDRALTVYHLLPLKLDGKIDFLPAINERITADLPRDYAQVAYWRVGANGLASVSPFAAVEDGSKGVALGFSPECPAFGRVGYNAALNCLFIAFDLALTPERPEITLQFVSFEFDRNNGYRGALDEYYRLFPQFYTTKIPKQGVWMPFVDIGSLPGYEDFHFAFKEGHDQGKWDREHGFLFFHYSEPFTFWYRLPREIELTRDNVLSHFKENCHAGEGSNLAKILAASMMTDENDDPVFLAIDRPWCRGSVWSVNSMPGIADENSDFSCKWKLADKGGFYRSGDDNEAAGAYVDSAEGYMAPDMSYRRSHFTATKQPLVFGMDNGKPGIWKGSIVYDYVRFLFEKMHGMGKFTMANGTPGTMWFLPPLLDISGTETDWVTDGKWTPMTVRELRYRRSACGPKPYCFLQNSDFTRFTEEYTVKYMKRCLAFGMFPGYFSANAATGHYFMNPALYERDRKHFKFYLPFIIRVATAGWRTITRAEVDSADFAVEQFGDKYFTILNDSGKTNTAEISFKDGFSMATDLLSGKGYPVISGKIRVTLPEDDVLLLEMK